MKIEFAEKMKELQGALQPQGAGGPPATGPKPGRPPTGNKPPHMKSKGSAEGGRSTITTS